MLKSDEIQRNLIKKLKIIIYIYKAQNTITEKVSLRTNLNPIYQVQVQVQMLMNFHMVIILRDRKSFKLFL